MDTQQFVIPKDDDLIAKGIVASERPLELYRPCSCGCDYRYGAHGVGYLHGIKDGEGVTVWIESEEVYQVLANFLNVGQLGGNGLTI